MRLRRSAGGRSRAGTGRHRSTPERLQGADLSSDQELDSYLNAISPGRDPEMTDPGQRLGSARTYQLRLPTSADEKVQWLAQQYGVSPVTLLQGWVLQRLHHEFGGRDPRHG